MNIVEKGKGSGGCRTGRPWKEIVEKLLESKCLHLWEGENITEVEIDMEYGLYFKLDKNQNNP